MTMTSEARKRAAEEQERRERAESYTRLVERRRDVAFQALEAILPGATRAESDALLDQYDTLGASLVVGDS